MFHDWKIKKTWSAWNRHLLISFPVRFISIFSQFQCSGKSLPSSLGRRRGPTAIDLNTTRFNALDGRVFRSSLYTQRLFPNKKKMKKKMKKSKIKSDADRCRLRSLWIGHEFAYWPANRIPFPFPIQLGGRQSRARGPHT